MSGRWLIHHLSAARSMRTARTSVRVIALEVRGPGSNRDNSPNMSAGPMTATRFARPSAEYRTILTFPDTIR